MRQEITLNDLSKVMDAAELLRANGLISVEQIREIRANVAKDCMAQMNRHWGEYGPVVALLSRVWERVKPV